MIDFLKFLHSSFGISNDAASAVIITIITFISGILINESLNALKAYTKRRNYRQLLKINIIYLIKGLYKQAIGYENLYKKLTIDYNSPFEFQAKSISAVGVFQQIGYENLYNACFNGIENILLFNKRQRSIAFSSLWATLEFINKFHEKSFADVQKFLELNSQLNEQRNESLGKANKIVEEIRIQLHGETIPNHLGVYFMAIEDIIANLKKQNNYVSPKIMNDYFVQKILELNRESIPAIKDFYDLLRPVELNAALLESSLRYTNQSNLIESYNYTFKDLSISFFKASNDMKKTYRTLITR